jgi:hypothetical protein
MPKLDVVPISEAKIRTPGRSRAEALREYIEFIEQVIKKDGEAIYFWVKPPPKRGRPRKIFQES